MAATVLTVTSGKGGVGKTTTTANLAGALASSGKKVICIDGDIGLRNLDVILGLENRIVYDLVDVVEGRCRLRPSMSLIGGEETGEVAVVRLRWRESVERLLFLVVLAERLAEPGQRVDTLPCRDQRPLPRNFGH